MKGEDKSLLKLMDGSDNRFIIPVYQRNYDWGEAQCEQLFKDLFTLIEENRKSHFFGCIVRTLCQDAHADEYLIIDGQQRITTISLLFLAIYWSIKNGIIHSSDEKLAEKIYKKYLVDEYNIKEKKVRLKLNKDDRKVFDDLVNFGECNISCNSKLLNNYNLFCAKVEKFPYKIDALYEAIKKLDIIDIFLNEDDDPQLIFESLNSTGLALSESDKARNYILMELSEEKQDLFYHKYWYNIENNCQEKDGLDNFIRDYLTAKSPNGEIPSFKKLYSVFKQYCQKKDKEEILVDLLKFSNYYHKIKNGQFGSPIANDIIRNINYLEVTVTYSFLLNFMDFSETNQLPQKEVENVLSCIESLIFRRLICSYPTNALNKIFATLHKTVLKHKKGNDYYSVMVYYLKNRKRSESIFPTDEEFVDNFKKKSIYRMNRKNCIYVLSKLENGNSKEKHNIVNSINEGILSIEHIMPQTLSETWIKSLGKEYERVHNQWLHTIANLTLTGYNSEYSNKSFNEKKNNPNGFVNSPLRLNHYISQFEKWSEEELNTRSKKLSEEALNLWPLPQTFFTPDTINSDTKEFFIGDENFRFSGTAIIGFKLKGIYHQVSDWSDAFQEIFKELYSLNPKILESNADSTKVLTSSPKSEDYKKLTENLWLYRTNNTTRKIKIIKKFLDLYGINHNDLILILHTNPNLHGLHKLLSMSNNLYTIGIPKDSYIEFLPTKKTVRVIEKFSIEQNNTTYFLDDFVWRYLESCFDEENSKTMPSISSYGFVKSGSIICWITEKFFSYNGKPLDILIKEQRQRQGQVSVIGYKLYNGNSD